MKTVYENAKEMLELAIEALQEAERKGDEKRIAFWKITVADARKQIAKYA